MRLFIAIKFTPEIKTALIAATEELRGQAINGNFTRPENLHLTLAFIGESDKVNDIKRIIDSAAPLPFNVNIGGFGRFGRLYWSGLHGDKALFTLAAALRKELKTAGIPVDMKPFSPHITLAREVEPIGEIKLNIPETAMTVTRVSLMRSDRINGKLTYTEVYGKNL